MFLNNFSICLILATTPNSLTYTSAGCLGVKIFIDAVVVAGPGILVRRGLS